MYFKVGNAHPYQLISHCTELWYLFCWFAGSKSNEEDFKEMCASCSPCSCRLFCSHHHSNQKKPGGKIKLIYTFFVYRLLFLFLLGTVYIYVGLFKYQDTMFWDLLLVIHINNCPGTFVVLCIIFAFLFKTCGFNVCFSITMQKFTSKSSWS